MNYAKVLDAALTLFPKKIRVTCIDGVTGQPLGKYKVGLQSLPATFNKPVTLLIEGNGWRVIEAKPLSADDFSIFKKLTIHVLNKEQVQQATLGHNVPTRHAHLPATTTTPLYDEFTINLSPDEWLQLEFLPKAEVPLIQEELALIDPILLADKLFNPLRGYETSHVRQQTSHLAVDIPFHDFCAIVMAQQKGNIRLADGGYIENGFAVQSANYEYYGTVVDGRITHLCLRGYDGVDDEFSLLATTWNLALVNWCATTITSIEPE